MSITRYRFNDREVIVPSEYQGEKVTEIGIEAFSDVGIESVSLPYGIVEIGIMASYNCKNLIHIAILPSVDTICDWVFAGCKRLKMIDIPPSVTLFGEHVFWDCNDLAIRC